MIRKGVIAPAEISVSQKIRPLSVGMLTCDPSLCNVDGLDFVQVFFPDGKYEYYRVKTKADATNVSSTYAMEHSIVWLEDYVCTEEVTFEGTVAELLTKLLGYATETKWRLGVVECTETVKVDINYTNVMQGVMDALDLCYGYNYTFDQSEDLWYINLVALPDTAECEGRLSRNLVNAVINVDYRDFATRLYVPGKTWHVDSESQSFWGLRENTLNAGTQGVDDEELREQCYKYFRDHSVPPVSVSVEAHELGRITGQSFDWFSPGKMCRLCLIDYNGAVVTERITDRTYPSLITNPDIVVLTMANKLPNASGAINGLAVTMKTIQTKTETALEDLWMGIVDLDGQLTTEINAVSIRLDAEAARIDLKAERTQVNNLESHVTDVILSLDAMNAAIALKASRTDVDALGERVSQAEIDIDGANAAIALKANQTEVDEQGERISQAEVDINAAEAAIALKAEKTFVDSLSERVSQAEIDIDGANAAIALKVSKNDVIAAINLSPEVARISAGKIVLDGYVTASELSALSAQITNLTSGITTASVLKTSLLMADEATVTHLRATGSLNVGNELFTKRTITMGDITSTGKTLATGAIDLSHSHEVTVNDDGTVTLGGVSATGGNFNVADTKVYKDAVSAAQDKVTLEESGWVYGRNTVTASNGKSVVVRLPPFETSGGTTFDENHVTYVYFTTPSIQGTPLVTKPVNAKQVYDRGLAAAESTFRPTSITKVYTNVEEKTIIVKASNENQDLLTGIEIDASDVFNAGFQEGIEEAIVGGDNVYKPTNIVRTDTDGSDKKITVKAVNSDNVDLLENIEIDVSDVYDVGRDAGKSGVTLSVGGWTQNAINTITASNGKSVTVSVPNVSMTESGWSNGSKTVYAYYGNSDRLGERTISLPVNDDVQYTWTNPVQGMAYVTFKIGGRTYYTSHNVSNYG